MRKTQALKERQQHLMVPAMSEINTHVSQALKGRQQPTQKRINGKHKNALAKGQRLKAL